MTPPPLDLQVATEAAAKAMYEQYAARQHGDGVILRPWSELPPINQFHWRESVLPAIIAALPEIARQAWELCEQSINLEEAGPNPWTPVETDWDEALKNL